MKLRFCLDCAFWREGPPAKIAGGEVPGSCRRYAPKPLTVATVMALSEQTRGDVVWPATWADDMCGEFEPAKQADWV